MGLSAKVQLNDCEGQINVNHHTTSIAAWAQDSGKATGLVTTAKLTDASPGGLYSRKYQMSIFRGKITNLEIPKNIEKSTV